MKKYFLSIIFFLTAFVSIAQTVIADRQKMSYNPTTHILTLENSDPVDLSGLVGGNSTVTDLSLSGNILSITLDSGTPVTVDLSAISGSVSDGSITNAKLANMAANSIKINNTGLLATPIDGTIPQVRAMLNVEDGAAADQTLSVTGPENNQIAISGGNTVSIKEGIEDTMADAFFLGTHSGITITYDDVNGNFDFAASGISAVTTTLTPFGDIASTNVQDGMEELYTEQGTQISTNSGNITTNAADIDALEIAFSTVPSTAYTTDTKTANYTFVANDVKADKIIYLDYDNETATIPQNIFSVGNILRIKNGTSGLANIVAGAGVTFPTVTLYKPNQSVSIKMVSSNVWQVEDGVALSEVKWIPMALSTVDGDLTTGTNKAVFHIPFAARVVGVKAGVATAGTGSTITIDINEAGTSILSTKLTIDASETHTSTAATAAVISDANLAADARITADIDQVGSSTAGKGAIAYLGVIQL